VNFVVRWETRNSASVHEATPSAHFGRPSGARVGGGGGSGGSARTSLHRPATFGRPSGTKKPSGTTLPASLRSFRRRGGTAARGTAARRHAARRHAARRHGGMATRRHGRTRRWKRRLRNSAFAHEATRSADFGHPFGARVGGGGGSGGSARSSLHRPATFVRPSGTKKPSRTTLPASFAELQATRRHAARRHGDAAAWRRGGTDAHDAGSVVSETLRSRMRRRPARISGAPPGRESGEEVVPPTQQILGMGSVISASSVISAVWIRGIGVFLPPKKENDQKITIGLRRFTVFL